MKRRCQKCNKVKELIEFWPREDIPGVYAWCITCCIEQGRSQDYPPEQERGSGVYHPNYRSLKVGYVE